MGVNKVINRCNKCTLCNVQKPLIDYEIKADIMVVGLSAKVKKYDNEIPLDSRTRSGKVIDKYEGIAKKYNMSMYRTNIVKCAPLDNNKDLRYPKINEINACFDNFIIEIMAISPRIIILLGDIVRNAVVQKWGLKIDKPDENRLSIAQYKGIYLVAMYHPSYLLRSKRRKEESYKLFEDVLIKIKEKRV